LPGCVERGLKHAGAAPMLRELAASSRCTLETTIIMKTTRAALALALFAAATLARSDATHAPRADAENKQDHSELYPVRDTPEASIERGRIAFEHYCALCHGPSGDGNGRAARLYNPKPANLITSDKNGQYKDLIIRRGGAALGRSPYMPPWGEELTEEQLADVVNFLESIAKSQASEL
jgi:mono/diheme cytochrome c family protein